MLSHLLTRLPARISHWIQQRIGVFAGMHDWLELCPCLVDLDPGEGDLEQAFAA